MPHLHTRNVSFAVALAAVAIAIALLIPSGSGAGTAASVNETARAAAAPTVAPAAQFAVGTPAFQAALATASAHWGALPCQGQVEYTWGAMEPLTNARASWHNPTDAWTNPAANFNCRVEFNTNGAFDFPQFCSVLAHELGHLLGHPHDDAAGHLMSAIYTEPIPACVAADPAAAAEAAASAAASKAKPAATPATSPTSSTRAAAAKPKKAAKRTAKKAAKKRTTSRKAKRSKKCFTRMKAGKRVKRCTPTRKTRRLSVAAKRR